MFLWILAALLHTAQIQIGEEKIVVEIADTKESKAQGLMNRTELPEGHGMLFVFDSPEPLSFWMKNTLIPLSIGFFDEKGHLLNVEEMVPANPETPDKDLMTYQSKAFAKYALEMPAQWFDNHNIAPNAQIIGLNQ